MDERITTRDRLFHTHPMMDGGPPDKKRRVDLGTSGNPTMMDSIVNATSTWPLNSLHSTAVLPSYEESLAANQNSYPNQIAYFDADCYLPRQISPQLDRNFNLVERNIPTTKDDFLTSDYNAGSTKHVRTFDKIKDDVTSHLNIPKLQGLKEKQESNSEKEASTVLKDKLESKEKTIPVIKQEKVEPEKEKEKSGTVAEEKSTKFKAAKKEEGPSFTTEKNKSPSSKEQVQKKVDIKDKVKTEENKDDFSFLDWKNGIATLPGSNLKFKMSEFGTLEMVSTVETEKGEYEWTTASSNSSASDLMQGPPDAGHVLCCEVCGVYGLPQDFCASGRFCSLSCVGAYTGRRNKGREFVRNVNTIDGKVIKKKKKGKTKKGINGRPLSPGLLEAEDSGLSEKTSDTVVSSPKTKGPREKGKGKNKGPLIEPSGTCLTASMVPYNFSKPFTWADYLYTSGTKPVPISVFKQENPDINVFPMPCEEFKKNMKLEAVDPKHPSYICVCTIVRVKGSRLRLHFDGWSECYDFWTNADSSFIFPVGWCAKNGQTLHPPRHFTQESFDWEKYLKKQSAVAAPQHLFKPVSKRTHRFQVGMKLEAIDRKNPDLICVATVTNVIGNYFLVHFDEWDDTYDYWCQDDCPYIHPVGWCESTPGRKLNPPIDDEVDTFTWETYLATTGAVAAPKGYFKTRSLSTFKPNQKLECVDKRNPSLIRSATIADVQQYRVRVHFDGWDDIYDEWIDADSTDLHPVSYCEKTGHPLEPPLTTADKISSVACPTPGCKGIGHVKGAKYSSHHSTFGCPYSLQNLNKESCLVDRLSTNSMTEESDWSYASKNKTIGVVRRGELSTEGVCPTPGCDGSGHVGGHWRTHQSMAGCPLSEINMKVVPVPIQPALPKTSQDVKKKVPPLTIITTNQSSKTLSYVTSGRRPSREIKREKPQLRQISPTKEEKKEKPLAIATEQPINNTNLPNGYHDNHLPKPNNERKKSRERLRMSKWTIDDVVKHVTSLGCAEQAKLFADQKIDGESFLLLNQDDIVNIMKIKLGPALKIFKSIPKV